MRRLLSIFSLATLPLICALLIGPGKLRTPTAQEAEKDVPGNPGWFDQYSRMKGEAPFGLAVQWQKTDRAHVNRSSNLQYAQELGPFNVGGRTRALLIDQSNYAKIFAGGVSGGLWVSPDNGNSWSPLDDQNLSLAVTCIDQDPLNSQTLYYGTGEPRGNSAGVDGAGVFKSIDGGASFQQLPATLQPDFEDIWSLRCDPNLSGLLFVGTADSGLWRSVDAGNTFQKVFSVGNKDITDVEILPDSRVLIAVRDTGIFLSPNGLPGTFQPLNTGAQPGSFRRIELAWCDSFPDHIYAQYERNFSGSGSSDLLGITHSSDGGATWNWVTNPVSSMGAKYDFPWYCFTLAAHPTDTNFVVSGCVSMVFSRNGGSTWDFTANSHVDHHTVVFHPLGNKQFLVGNDGGVYRHPVANADKKVFDLNKGYNVTQYYTAGYFPFGLSHYGGTQDNGTWQGDLTPQAFKQMNGGDGAACAIHQQQANFGFVSSQYGAIKRTSNTGSPSPSFSSILNNLGVGRPDDGAWFINPFEMNTRDGDQLYYTTLQRIWMTRNRGDNWEALTDTLKFGDHSPYCIGLSDEVNPTVFIGGEQGLFYRTSNALTAIPGNEVNLRSSVPDTTAFLACIEVHPRSKDTLYVSFSNHSATDKIWRVTGAMSNSPVWTSVQGDLPLNLPVNWVESHPALPNNFLVIGTDFGLYTTVDGGQTWTKEIAVPNTPIQQLRLRNADLQLFIATHGRGMWTASLPMTVHRPDDLPPSQIAAFPNPFRDHLMVRNLAGQSAEYRIIDLQGRTLLSFLLPPGGSRRLQTSSWESGIYLLAGPGIQQKITKL